jgi:hypothetical protein
MSNDSETKDWNIGNVEIYIEVTKEGRMQLGIQPGLNELEKMFPIDMRKQSLLSNSAWKRYEKDVLAKREAWIRDNIPAGTYSFTLKLDSDTLSLKEV